MLRWWVLKFWIALSSLAVTSGKPQQFHTYSYGGVNVHKWQGVDPLFSFDSRKVFPTKADGSPQFPSPPAFPSGPHGFTSSDYPFVPEFESGDPGFGLVPDPFPPTKKKSRKKFRGGKKVDMDAERYGGFGGTGDTAGVGAYEYSNHLESPYPNLSKDVFMRKSGNVY